MKPDATAVIMYVFWSSVANTFTHRSAGVHFGSRPSHSILCGYYFEIYKQLHDPPSVARKADAPVDRDLDTKGVAASDLDGLDESSGDQ